MTGRWRPVAIRRNVIALWGTGGRSGCSRTAPASFSPDAGARGARSPEVDRRRDHGCYRVVGTLREWARGATLADLLRRVSFATWRRLRHSRAVVRDPGQRGTHPAVSPQGAGASDREADGNARVGELPDAGQLEVEVTRLISDAYEAGEYGGDGLSYEGPWIYPVFSIVLFGWVLYAWSQ